MIIMQPLKKDLKKGDMRMLMIYHWMKKQDVGLYYDMIPFVFFL